MKKKLLILLLTLVTTFSFTACSFSIGDDGSKKRQEKDEDEDDEDDEDEDEDEDDEEDTKKSDKKNNKKDKASLNGEWVYSYDLTESLEEEGIDSENPIYLTFIFDFDEEEEELTVTVDADSIKEDLIECFVDYMYKDCEELYGWDKEKTDKSFENTYDKTVPEYVEERLVDKVIPDLEIMEFTSGYEVKGNKLYLDTAIDEDEYLTFKVKGDTLTIMNEEYAYEDVSLFNGVEFPMVLEKN